MKKFTFILLFIFALTKANSQTTSELLGKWQLVKWTHNNKEKSIKDRFKTDQVYQVFYDDGRFESLIGDEIHHGKWKLSENGKELTINSALIPVTFKVDYFDKLKRIVTYPALGSFEYKKVSN